MNEYLLANRVISKDDGKINISKSYKRTRNTDFDFKEIPAGSGVYGIHPYPAMFHFMVVKKLLQEYSKERSVVWDPFVGSGVVAVECLINNRNFIGYDINPLAILIAKVRTNNIPQNKLLKYLEIIEKKYRSTKAETISFDNIDYWFDNETIQDLSKLRRVLMDLDIVDISNFYKVVFSETVRRVSKTEYNEFKLLRKKKEKFQDVIKTFRDIAIRNIGLLNDFYRKNKTFNVRIQLKEMNVLDCLPLKDKSIDLVLTSPPYGDSKTTVAYGQFSRLPLRWLGLEEMVDKTSLGNRRRPIDHTLPSAVLYDILNIIKDKDEKRAQEVFSFYYDLYNATKVISDKVKYGGYVCFVVGNRRVKNQELPTDKISADFFESMGFIHKNTIVRAISNKRMPMANAPSNIKGEKNSTMRYEYIVILEKVNKTKF